MTANSDVAQLRNRVAELEALLAEAERRAASAADVFDRVLILANDSAETVLGDAEVAATEIIARAESQALAMVADAEERTTGEHPVVTPTNAAFFDEWKRAEEADSGTTEAFFDFEDEDPSRRWIIAS